MVYVGYYLFSSCGINSSVVQVLWGLSIGMGCYLDIARVGFEDISMLVL